MLFSTHVASRCTNHIICDVDVFFLAHQRGHKRLFSPEVHQTELASCGATKPSSLATTAGAGRQGAGWGRSLPRPSRIPPVPPVPAGRRHGAAPSAGTRQPAGLARTPDFILFFLHEHLLRPLGRRSAGEMPESELGASLGLELCRISWHL